ncbi:hypothetical protein [Methylobacterium brachiatum]|uniref:hypothetical protein n=1 Tax=Methylobacterium brachiatum TaxID=269660 RepID=UPI000EFACBC9|nr:hypothetical protein [Methylobacterium brachiatum]AYO84698.1 hypothetical protein EBB05_22300 [Methylobacterium brachiatum]
MSPFPRSLAALSALALLAAAPTVVRAEPGAIKGQDVMGDKSRSANDGWSQAPVPREQSAGKDASDPGGQSTKMNGDRPVPKAGESGGNGTDPQQPLEHRTPNPSGQNPASPTK